jgi:hypothetical protein
MDMATNRNGQFPSWLPLKAALHFCPIEAAIVTMYAANIWRLGLKGMAITVISNGLNKSGAQGSHQRTAAHAIAHWYRRDFRIEYTTVTPRQFCREVTVFS